MFEKYDAYKDSGESWIGLIPKHWEIIKLKHLFNEKRHKKNMSLNSGSISFGEVIYKDDEKITEATKASYQEVLKGEFLVNPLNLNYDLISLRIALSKINVVVSAGYIVLLANKLVCREYFKYLLHRYDVAYMKLLGSGVRQTISFNHIANSLLPYPSMLEQKNIAEFLDQKTAEIDQAISIKEQQIALLNERKQIVIQKAVTQGLDPNVPMKDSGVEWIGQIPEHWNTITKLKHIASLKGRQGWQGLKADEYIDEGPYVISSAHFDGLDINWDKCPHVSIERYKMDAHIQLNIGDILLMKDGAKMGKMAYISNLPDLACLNSHLLLIRSLNTQDEFFFDSKYMLYFMLSEKFQDYVQVKGTGTTFMGISQESIGNFPIALPSLYEQIQIASFLDQKMLELEKGKDLLLTQIAKLKEYKTTLINDAVTGKIKVA